MDLNHARLDISFEFDHSFVLVRVHQLKGLTELVRDDEVESPVEIFISLRSVGYSEAHFTFQVV